MGYYYYYYLKPDDIVQFGDEFSDFRGGWLDCRSEVGKTVAQGYHSFDDKIKVRRAKKTTKLGNFL